MGAAIVGALGMGLGPVAAGSRDVLYMPLMVGGHPVRWVAADGTSPVVLRYAIADHEIDQPGAANCRGLRAPVDVMAKSGLTLAAIREALSEAVRRWRDVADITFVEADAGTKPDIVVGEQVDAVGYAFTNVELAAAGDSPTATRPISGASICLNPERKWKIGYDGNLAVYDLVHTLTHEIGHAIGLDHPGSRGHLMSFKYSEDHNGLTEGDKLGAIAIYGPSRLLSAYAATPPRTAGAKPVVTSIIGRGIDGGGSP